MSCAILPVFTKESPEIGLRALSPDAAVDLLEQLGMVAPREKLRNLAQSLVYHPLALTGFARVAKRVGNNWESLLSGLGTDPSKVFHSLVDEIRKHLPNRQHSKAILKYASLLPEGAPLGILNWLLLSEEEKATLPTNEVDLVAQVLTLADWSLLIWDSQAGSIRLHALLAEYFGELLADSEKDSIHSRAASWYEASAIGSGGVGVNHWVLALRHTIFAKDAECAYRIIFKSSTESLSLLERLVFNGHLWECAELLAGLQAVATGLQKAQCILARAQILNDLELPRRALADVQDATVLLLAEGETGWLPLQSLLAQSYGLQGVIHSATGRATNALPFFNQAVSLFESLILEAKNYESDLAKTLANRGLAKWACGDWTPPPKTTNER